MHILRAAVIAFSIYSRIPVPQFTWEEEDMRYMLCFFPWIGAVIGGCLYLWGALCGRLMLSGICRVMVGAAIPLMLTGGIHVDGFMDTMDAFYSYSPREKKLEILKDAHIGAFAVIMLVAYGLLYLGAFAEVTEDRLLRIVCSGFFLARCLSGISVVSFPTARRDGMLRQFADSAQRCVVKGALYLQGILCICYMLLQSPWAVVVVAAALLAFGYYRYRAGKEFGGITGDTAGFFVLLCEGCVMAAAAVGNILLY